jgi:hypothetical protein
MTKFEMMIVAEKKRDVCSDLLPKFVLRQFFLGLTRRKPADGSTTLSSCKLCIKFTKQAQSWRRLSERISPSISGASPKGHAEKPRVEKGLMRCALVKSRCRDESRSGAVVGFEMDRVVL